MPSFFYFLFFFFQLFLLTLVFTHFPPSIHFFFICNGSCVFFFLIFPPLFPNFQFLSNLVTAHKVIEFLKMPVEISTSFSKNRK